MVQNSILNSCIDCFSHITIPDQDPDVELTGVKYVTMLCRDTKRDSHDLGRLSDGRLYPFRVIVSSVHPIDLREFTPIPEWCPKT